MGQQMFTFFMKIKKKKNNGDILVILASFDRIFCNRGVKLKGAANRILRLQLLIIREMICYIETEMDEEGRRRKSCRKFGGEEGCMLTKCYFHS
jgi:hypothetical protein